MDGILIDMSCLPNSTDKNIVFFMGKNRKAIYDYKKALGIDDDKVGSFEYKSHNGRRYFFFLGYRFDTTIDNLPSALIKNRVNFFSENVEDPDSFIVEFKKQYCRGLKKLDPEFFYNEEYKDYYNKYDKSPSEEGFKEFLTFVGGEDCNYTK